MIKVKCKIHGCMLHAVKINYNLTRWYASVSSFLLAFVRYAGSVRYHYNSLINNYTDDNEYILLDSDKYMHVYN